MTGDNCIIRVKGLRKSFEDNEVLKGIDIEVPRGEITTIIGKSGEGKSVLLKCIAGLLQPDAGEVEFSCESGKKHEGDRPPISFLFQNNALFDSMTAFDNVALPLREGRQKLSKDEIHQRVDKLFERLDLHDIGDRFPAELSGGMQKRVALARSLILDPQVVLFDEPTAGLDPLRKNAVFTMIEHYQRDFGFTALMVSHDLPDVLFFSDRVHALEEGVISFSGTPLELDQSESDFAAEFLHSEEDLRHELIGLQRRSAFSEDLHWLRDQDATLVLIHIDPFEGLRESLGDVAAHLIEAALVRSLKEVPALRHVGYGYHSGSFILVTRGSTPNENRLKAAMNRFRAALRNLASTRCVEFSVKLSEVKATAISNAAMLPEASPEREIFKHRCP